MNSCNTALKASSPLLMKCWNNSGLVRARGSLVSNTTKRMLAVAAPGGMPRLPIQVTTAIASSRAKMWIG